jgi:SAM-dependent methyltransferase
MPDAAVDTVHPAPTRGTAACPACGSGATTAFFDMPVVPVHCNVLWPTVEAARRAPRGEVRLAVCGACALVFNSAFDAQLVTYDEAYENSLHASPRFNEYALDLARGLGERFQLRDRLAVDLGCGKGEFLRLLCDETGARGLGIDASYDPSLWPAVDDRVSFVRTPFSTLPADVRPALICSRHVLEHIPEPRSFVREIAEGARRTGSAVFIEVPNVLYTLRDLGVWDVIYEHCSYFSAPSLSRLVESAGLRVTDVREAYGGQFLCLEAVPDEGVQPADREDERDEVTARAADYARACRAKVSEWGSRLAELRSAGKRVAIWGAGSKGITFANLVAGGDAVSCLIDLNPRKHGRFVPVTGQPVVGPAALTSEPPDVVLVMNPLYRDEIEQQLRALGVPARVDIV